MTTLLLIRHGEVPGISPPRFRGRQELELTERGRTQAQRTAERLHANWPQIAAIYCSPRHRTVATAQAIGRPHGLQPKAMPELDDFDYGTWQGLSHDEARQRWPEQWSLWTTAPESVVFPQGETLADVAARVGRGLHNVLDATRERSGAVVVVAHDSVNRVLLMQLLGMPMRFYRAIAQDPCCINVIDDPRSRGARAPRQFDRAPGRPVAPRPRSREIVRAQIADRSHRAYARFWRGSNVGVGTLSVATCGYGRTATRPRAAVCACDRRRIR